MSLPGFNAESSLGTSGRTYRGRYQYGHFSQSQQGLPALVLPSQYEALQELGMDEGAGSEELLEEGLEEEEALEGMPLRCICTPTPALEGGVGEEEVPDEVSGLLGETEEI